MPPRIGTAAAQAGSRLRRPISPGGRAFAPCLECCQIIARSFSASPCRPTTLRRAMFRWLQGPGSAFRDPLPGSTNYLGAYNKDGLLIRTRPSNLADGRKDRLPQESEQDLRPFPMNPEFRSQSILGEDLREEIYNRVMKDGKSVRIVSAELGVEMNRVGAVVRLMEIQKRWILEGKPLVRPYAKAVMDMLPKTSYVPGKPVMHESINDLPAHPATMQQIFHPTSESRVFTREDAAKVFDPDLLPADARIPHPELIELERERQQGVLREERIERQRERMRREAEASEAAERTRREREARVLRKVATADQGGRGGRWEWHVRDINVHAAGKDGRARTGVGWRYGVPHPDRKRGQVKIPTRVE